MMSENENKSSGTENESVPNEYKLFSGSIIIGTEVTETASGEIKFENRGNIVRSKSDNINRIVFKYDPKVEEMKNAIKKLNGIIRNN